MSEDDGRTTIQVEMDVEIALEEDRSLARADKEERKRRRVVARVNRLGPDTEEGLSVKEWRNFTAAAS